MISSTVLHTETAIVNPQERKKKKKRHNVSRGNSVYAGTFLSSLALPHSLD